MLRRLYNGSVTFWEESRAFASDPRALSPLESEYYSSFQPSQRVEQKHGGHTCNRDAILNLFVFCPQGSFLTP